MNALLIKLFATALTFSQVATRPDDVRTSFDASRDQGEVTRLLRDGCAHLRKSFDIEDINVDELIATAMEDPKALAGDTAMLKGLDVRDLEAAYRQFCKGEAAARPVVDLADVIAAYNEAVADLPDVGRLRNFRMPGASAVLDGAGRPFTELHAPDSRRIWIPIGEVPPLVRQAFVAAEDKRFYAHRGIDERGVIRAFLNNLGASGRPQGGSTITQQVVKNILTGDDVTYQRKMREMILAARLERILSKDEILEIYLNAIFLGRSSWGIEMAARSWFGKPASRLDLREGALLASLPKGPNFYDPDRFPERSRERVAYVLSRLLEEGAIDEAARARALAERPALAAAERSRRDSGLYFLDHLAREARAVAGIDAPTASAYTIRSTIDPALQRAAETAVQDGLARYELSAGRAAFAGPEGNLGPAIERLRKAAAEGGAGAQRPASGRPDPGKPDWQRALEGFRAPLYDVHWPLAVVVDDRPGALRVGLRDGRVLPLAVPVAEARRALKLHDVVFVRVPEGRKAARAELRVRPGVQGAAVALENRTGRILAMAGGFSYPASQLNRVTQSLRQPGSTLKPLTYLAALAAGNQPNTLVWDAPVTLGPIGGGGESWSPRNADRTERGLMTLRRGLEGSRNQVTARLLDGIIAPKAPDSLGRVCQLALEEELYAECERYYPFVLGAQPARLIDVAALYASFANEGARPSPYGLESVEEAGRLVYRREARPPARIRSADPAAFYQLRTMLQGVVARGTASSIARLAPYVAGKTGTSENENDAWFAGFSNDVTVVVWVGHDNADGRRRTLGRGQSGARVALPIFEAIMNAAWAGGRPRTPLGPPSPEARGMLIAAAVDLRSGDVLLGGQGGLTEWFRRSQNGGVADTQHRFVDGETEHAARTSADEDGEETAGYGEGPWTATRERPRGTALRAGEEAASDPFGERPGAFRIWPDEDDDASRGRRTRRIDPDYLWPQRSLE